MSFPSRGAPPLNIGEPKLAGETVIVTPHAQLYKKKGDPTSILFNATLNA
jgi:hypothetical protein